MKELKQIREIKEEVIVGYEAIDGTTFKDKEQCIKYEETAEAVIKAKIKPYLLGVSTEYEFYNYRGCDDSEVEVFEVPNEQVFDDICMYIKINERPKYNGEVTLPEAKQFVGGRLILTWNYDHDFPEIDTIETIIEKMRESYDYYINKWTAKNTKED